MLLSLSAHSDHLRLQDPRRVDLVADAESGLRLCPCDIQPRNFKRGQDGQLFALDFHATCFVPPSFVAVAMKKCQDTFGRRVAMKITYPMSDDVSALLSVSNYLVPFGWKVLGKHGLLSLFRHFD